MQNENLERDYDMNPIIIKDNNMIFGLTRQVIIIIVCSFLIIINIDTVNTSSLSLYLLIFFPMYILPGLKYHIRGIGNRHIEITNLEITFFENEKILEKIDIKKNIQINKTITDYYHKSQNNKSSNIINILLGPIMCLINFLMLIIIKFFYHIKNCKLKNYTFHNAIIIFDEDKFINILPNNTTEYEEIRTFFTLKIQKDIKKENIFKKIIYDFEE